MSAIKKIQATKNYRLFERNHDNRPVDVKKHKRLEESMKLYGFLKCFPVVCRRDEKGKLIVKDGQHRLAIAETLGLVVYWIEEEVDFDIATVNETSKIWQIIDYAQKHALNGIAGYQEGIDFAKTHNLSIGTSFALLAGNTSFGNIDDAFKAGAFKIKDLAWANAVAGIYGPMTALSSSLKSSRFVEACMACCRVDYFDAKRLLTGAERVREKLVSYSTRDAYLEMLQEVYNFGRKQIVGLKVDAIKVMRERNVTVKAKKIKSEKSAA